MHLGHVKKAFDLASRIGKDISDLKTALHAGDFDAAKALGAMAPMLAFAAKTAHDAAIAAAKKDPRCTPEFIARCIHSLDAAHAGELPVGSWN